MRGDLASTEFGRTISIIPMRVANTKESEAYLGDFDGSAAEIIETFRNGWLYRGRPLEKQQKAAGERMPPSAGERLRSLHLESRSDRKSAIWATAESIDFARSVSRVFSTALSDALYPDAFYGPGVVCVRALYFLYRS